MANNRLYPPIIDSKIPAFYKQKGEAEDGSKDVAILRVPYKMNASVSYGDVGGFYIKIKTIGNNKEIIHMPSTTWYDNPVQDYVDFEITGQSLGKLTEGNFYKIQLAYYNYVGTDGDTENYLVGHYSDVATVKYTALGKVYLDGDEDGELQSQVLFNLDHIIGTYSHPGDPTEKAYGYQFIIKKLNGAVYYDSEEQLHNTETDTANDWSIDKLSSWLALSEDEMYNLQYKVKTINGIELSSPVYKIAARSSLIPNGLEKCKLVATNDYDDGYVVLTLDRAKGYTESDLDFDMLGTYQILKASDKDNFSSWHVVNALTLSGVKPKQFVWKDLLVEQGVTYKYALQQKNNHGVNSKRLYSEEVYAEFENIFLVGTDGRQLKLRFNSKLSGLKKNLLEQKVDTIGNRYPFIFRNGRVNYKTFSIGGLLSYHMDDQEMFIKMEDIGVDNEKGGVRRCSGSNLTNKTIYTGDQGNKKLHSPTTHQTSENLASEHLFREAAWEWLNNGEKKIYKSPTEANTIVHLMNINLTPNNQLSNMVAEFSTTAYELGKYDVDTLINFGFLKQEAGVYNYLKSGGIYDETWDVTQDLILVGNEGKIKQQVESFSIAIDYTGSGSNTAVNPYFYLTIDTTTQYQDTKKIYFRGENHLEYSIDDIRDLIGEKGKLPQYAIGDLQGSFSNITLHCLNPDMVTDVKVTFNALYYDREKVQFDYVTNVALYDYPLSEIRGQGDYSLHFEDTNILDTFNNNIIQVDKIKSITLYPRYRTIETIIVNSIDDVDDLPKYYTNSEILYKVYIKDKSEIHGYYHYGKTECDNFTTDYQVYDVRADMDYEYNSYSIDGGQIKYEFPSRTIKNEQREYTEYDSMTFSGKDFDFKTIKIGANVILQIDMALVMHEYENSSLGETQQSAKQAFETACNTYKAKLEDTSTETSLQTLAENKKTLVNSFKTYDDSLEKLWEVIE